MKYTPIDFGEKTALENMEDDFILLGTIKEPILRFYRFSSLSATHGYFMDPAPFLNQAGVDQHKLQIAKRPTGGGFLIHGFDFTFSLLIPIGHCDYVDNVLASYHLINQKVIDGMRLAFDIFPRMIDHQESSPRGGFCMAKPTIYDLMLHGKKIGGAAQRRTKKGILHQGSINLKPIERSLLENILLDPSVINAIEARSAAIEGDPEVLKASLIKVFNS